MPPRARFPCCALPASQASAIDLGVAESQLVKPAGLRMPLDDEGARVWGTYRAFTSDPCLRARENARRAEAAAAPRCFQRDDPQNLDASESPFLFGMGGGGLLILPKAQSTCLFFHIAPFAASRPPIRKIRESSKIQRQILPLEP